MHTTLWKNIPWWNSRKLVNVLSNTSCTDAADALGFAPAPSTWDISFLLFFDWLNEWMNKRAFFPSQLQKNRLLESTCGAVVFATGAFPVMSILSPKSVWVMMRDRGSAMHAACDAWWCFWWMMDDGWMEGGKSKSTILYLKKWFRSIQRI